MEFLKQLHDLLPKYQDIEKILTKYPPANWIIVKTLDSLSNITSDVVDTNESNIEENSYLLQALQDKLWEYIHTGHFSQVPIEIRQIFTLTCLLKICFLLLENFNDTHQIEKCSQTLDEALLLGYPQQIYTNCDKLKENLMEYLNEKLNQNYAENNLPTIHISDRITNIPCDVLQLNQPSIEMFRECCFNAAQPALLLNTFNEWPALKLWHNLNYILKLAGNRLVPVEIGNNYANENWSQQLMTLRDFLIRQFQTNEMKVQKQQQEQQHDNTHHIEYLAQHELFEQIPILKKDFSIPDYCCLGNNLKDVDIKVWLGPEGTISPLHYDPKHNFLCHIFGSKKIILAAPKDSANLYPHENEFLQNTSQVDAERPDLKTYPLTANVKFYHLILQRGDCLYIPPKWWHYVKSLSSSFSISFWWD